MDESYPKILMIGLGRVGQACLKQLVENSVADFLLEDDDRVEAKNLPETRYGEADVGKRKVDAAAEMILRANPEAKIQVLSRRVQDVNFAWLLARGGLGDRPAVAVFAFDDPQALPVANRALYPLLPICFPGVHRQGTAGHVIYTVPRQTPCLTCALRDPDGRSLRQLPAREARFGTEASDRLASCVLQLVLEIAGMRPRRLVQPYTRRTILYLQNNLTRGTWWRAGHLPQCQICPGRR